MTTIKSEMDLLGRIIVATASASELNAMLERVRRPSVRDAKIIAQVTAEGRP